MLQVGDTIRIKEQFITGDDGCPIIGLDFNISQVDDETNKFVITRIRDTGCWSTHCGISYGCPGPLVLRRVSDGREFGAFGMCMGYDDFGFAVEMCFTDEELEVMRRLKVKGNTNNIRNSMHDRGGRTAQ